MRMSHKRTIPHIQVLTEMLQIIIQNLCSVSGLSMSTHYCRWRVRKPTGGERDWPN